MRLGGSESSNGNGHVPDGIDAILSANQARTQERRRYLEDTETEIARREGEIEHLRNQRHIARMLLSEKAGLFGYVYDPTNDELTRTTIKDPKVLETSPPTPESVRAPFNPSEYGIHDSPPSIPREKDKSVQILLNVFEAIMWMAVVPLGAFLGYSIGLMAGFPVKNDPNYAIAAALFGVFLLATMKAAVFKLTHLGTRRTQTTGSSAPMALAFAASGVFVAAELFLAANALVRYTSERAQFTDQPPMPLAIAAGVALCFSTPVLLASIVKGWYLGTGYEDEQARRKAERQAALGEAKRHHEAVAAAQKAHEEKLNRRYQDALGQHQAALERFEKSNDDLAQNADWQAVQQFRSAIRNLTQRIEEYEGELKAYSIRRGMRLSAETSRGSALSSSASSASPAILPQEGWLP